MQRNANLDHMVKREDSREVAKYESELASSAGAKIVLEREKRHRGAAPRTRRMQRNANLDYMVKREDSREVAEAE